MKPGGGGVGVALTLRFPSASYFLGLPLFFFPNKSKLPCPPVLPGVVVTNVVVVVAAGTSGTIVVGVGAGAGAGAGAGVGVPSVFATFMFMLTFMFIGRDTTDGVTDGGRAGPAEMGLLLSAASMRVLVFPEMEAEKGWSLNKEDAANGARSRRNREGVGFFSF